MKSHSLNVAEASRFAQLALSCVQREYPHVHLYWVESGEDVVPARQLTPAFYGCLDWHSAVHNHWMLVRLMRLFPDAPFVDIAQKTITQNFTPEAISQEVAYLKSHPRFECPYGLAWLLQLMAELAQWQDPQAQQWFNTIKPLEAIAANSLKTWLQDLSYPNRTGTHTQTAFALGLIWDWANITQNQSFKLTIEEKVQKFYRSDCNYPLHLEPLGYDFLSPSLAEADLIRRMLSPDEFAEWLSQFLPQIPTHPQTDWLHPVEVQNPQDYSQSHLDGLNLSRAWMLEGIISGLPKHDPRISTLEAVAQNHCQKGLELKSAVDYSGSHWLGSFAVYLRTNRGYSV